MQKHIVLAVKWLWVEMSQDGKGMVDIKNKDGAYYIEPLPLKPACPPYYFSQSLRGDW